MRMRRLDRVVLTSAVLCAALALLVPLPFGIEDRLLAALEDAAHVPVFAAMGFALWRARPRMASGLAALCAVAAGVEAAQFATGRDPGWWDALLSALGGSVGLALGRARDRRAYRPAVAWALLSALIALTPAFAVWADRRDARASFPALADFATRRQVGRWTGRGVELRREAGGGLDGRAALRMRVVRSDVDYPGAFLSELPGDWTSFARLCVDLYVPGTNPPAMWIRIDDSAGQPAYAERAQEVLALRTGWNKLCWDLDALLRAPSGRALDRARIARLGFFFDAAEPGVEIRMNHLRLE